MDEVYYKFTTDLISVNLKEIIIALIIVLFIYKVYRFWNVDKLFYSTDHTIFNPKILDINDTYEPGTISPPYPNLWYPVIQSKELKPGQVKPLYVVGQNLAAFRTLSGKAYVLDAFCPHLGAHLGVGGSVVGEDIQCPFHSWTFNGDGVCNHVPGLQTPPKTKVKSWKCVEMNGWIYIWYHVKGQEPVYKPLILEELKNLQNCGEYSTYFNGHLMDILANVTDQTHFNTLHSLQVPIPAERILMRQKFYKIFYRIYHVQFEDHKVYFKEKNNDNICIVDVKAIPVVFGIRLSGFQVDIKIKICPPILLMHQTLPRFNLSFCYMVTYIPESPMKHFMVNHMFREKGFMSNVYTKMVYRTLRSAAEPEQIIFNNKKFLSNPCFTSLDKSQVTFFRWFNKNFYSD